MLILPGQSNPVDVWLVLLNHFSYPIPAVENDFD